MLVSQSENTCLRITPVRKSVISTASCCSIGSRIRPIGNEPTDGIISSRWAGFHGISGDPKTKIGVQVVYTCPGCVTSRASLLRKILGTFSTLEYLIPPDSTPAPPTTSPSGRTLSVTVKGKLCFASPELHGGLSRTISEVYY